MSVSVLKLYIAIFVTDDLLAFCVFFFSKSKWLRKCLGRAVWSCALVKQKGFQRLCPDEVQVVLRWNLQRGVAVLPKASSAAHVRENIAGLFDWRLSYNQKVGEQCSHNTINLRK